MQEVQPMVFCVGETRANNDGVRAFLEAVGAPNWATDCHTEAEGLLELFGRSCYRSFEPGLNPNVTKVRQGNHQYLANIIASGHGSVLAHAWANFIFFNVSRSFTHELVRHQVGTAYTDDLIIRHGEGTGVSQESLRFVRLDTIDFRMPPDIADHPEARAIFEKAVRDGEQAQQELAKLFDLDNPNMPFHDKKRITSAMRRIAPEGVATMVCWSASFRALRYIIEQRTDPAAEDEIRLVFAKVGDYATKRWPNVFGDYDVSVVDGISWYQTDHPKV